MENAKSIENLQELYNHIVKQAEKADTVTIKIYNSRGLRELLASIEDGITGTKELNKTVHGDPVRKG